MSTDWRTLAACGGADAHLFFPPETEAPHARQVREADAKRICAGCPVRAECAEFAQAHGCKAGIWAGEDLDASPHPEPAPVLCGKGLHFMTPENTKPIAGTVQVRCRACLRDSDRRTQPARDARFRQRRREQREQEAAA